MNESSQSTRRSFLKQSVLAAAASPLIGAMTAGADAQSSSQPAKRPNILLVISDQFRWDFIHAHGQNPTDFTPNLDAMVRQIGRASCRERV